MKEVLGFTGCGVAGLLLVNDDQQMKAFGIAILVFSFILLMS